MFILQITFFLLLFTQRVFMEKYEKMRHVLVYRTLKNKCCTMTIWTTNLSQHQTGNNKTSQQPEWFRVASYVIWLQNQQWTAFLFDKMASSEWLMINVRRPRTGSLQEGNATQWRCLRPYIEHLLNLKVCWKGTLRY